MAVYKIGDKEVTKEEFYNEVSKNEIKITDQNYPFFLDEVIHFKVPVSNEWLLKSHLVGSELRDEWRTSNTGGTVFEKVQDYSLLDFSPQKSKEYNKKFIEAQNKKDNLEYLRNYLLNQTSYLGLEEITSIFTAETEEELRDFIMGHRLTDEERERQDNQIKNPYVGRVSKPVSNSTRHKSKEGETHSQSVKESFAGIKEKSGKTDYSEINLGILDLMANRFTANKDKYPKGNSLKPLDKSELCWAAFRHIKKMLDPIDGDPESYIDHLAATLCNMSMILDQLKLEK